MKFIKYSLIPVIIFSFFAFSGAVLAQDATEYKLLEPIPYVSSQDGKPDCVKEDGSPCATANSYIPGIVKLVIAVAGALAVIKIIFGGIQYMSTGAFQGKTDAKKTIENAIWGLILILSAWLILYTINPDLVNLDFSIEGQAIGQDFSSITSIGSTTPGSVIRGPSYGQTWGKDGSERGSVTKIGGIQVKEPTCTTIGQEGCTSLSGMNLSLLSGLTKIKEGCKLKEKNECTLTITGGTEYWLHGTKNTELSENTRTQHRPGGTVLDLRKSVTILDTFIVSLPKVSGAGCSTLGPGGLGYRYNGITFVDEGNHWHVCF
jgi:hypothetical protein